MIYIRGENAVSSGSHFPADKEYERRHDEIFLVMVKMRLIRLIAFLVIILRKGENWI
jgi:hypothetical protein